MERRNTTRCAVPAALLLLASVGLPAPAAGADVGRPGQDGEPTEVRMLVFVVDVDDIDSAEQNFTANVFIHATWDDPRLAHDGPGPISRAASEVWDPRLQFVNQQKVWTTLPDLVEISPQGSVIFRQRVWGQFSQPLELQDFPFDVQDFTVQIVPVGYTPEEVRLVQNPDRASGIAEKLSVADWAIIESATSTLPYESIPGDEPLSRFTFIFRADRAEGHFLITIVAPMVIIVIMSWVVFWIDPKEAGTQIGVGMTAMLTVIAYRFAVTAGLPKISYLTRMDIFILGATVMVFLSLVEVVFTSFLARTGRLVLARWVDWAMRVVFPMAFALIAVYSLTF